MVLLLQEIALFVSVWFTECLHLSFSPVDYPGPRPEPSLKPFFSTPPRAPTTPIPSGPPTNPTPKSCQQDKHFCLDIIKRNKGKTKKSLFHNSATIIHHCLGSHDIIHGVTWHHTYTSSSILFPMVDNLAVSAHLAQSQPLEVFDSNIAKLKIENSHFWI